MTGTTYRVVVEPRWGYRRLDPIPDDEELRRFYQSAYADLAARGRRAPELTRLLVDDQEADNERAWLSATLYADILSALDEHADPSAPRTALDIGAGTGDWVEQLERAGWQATGLEPGEEAASWARAKGRPVQPLTLDEFLAGGDRPTYGVASALNVLEHMPDPVGFCDVVRELLVAGGLFVVRVPNEFNPLQLAAQRSLGRDPWWVVAPDHIGYFDYASLRRLLEDRGFEVVAAQGDFPMELFLLMGDDYVDDPAVGRACHQRRRRAELAMDPAARRVLGRALADAGLGRNCLVIARRR